MTQKRILAAVLSADVAGFSRLMERDESETIAALVASRDVFHEHVSAHGGRIIDTAGDSVLATFESAVEAVASAVEIQRALAKMGDSVDADRVMAFRIGINLGDIVRRADGTVYGDGVNIAARLQAIAEPGGICVSGNIRDVCSASLALVVEDLGEQAVRNISTPVHAYRILPGGERRRCASAPPPPPVEPNRNRPVIVILPFENTGGAQEDEYFVEGIAEDLITELSKFRSLMVIARNSAFAHRDQDAPAVEIAAELGARYLVHGTVRRSGTRARITVALSDVATNSELWAERYDRELDDVFAIQDEVARHIASVLPNRIEAADLRRIQGKPTDSLAAYDYLLKGKYHHHRATEEDNAIALAMLERAIALDPEYAQAHAWKACTLGQAAVRGYGDTDAALRELVKSLRTALALDEDDFETHRILSGVSLIQRDFDRAAYHAARAFELNPNDPRVMSQYGEVLTALGKADDATIVLEQALEVDPYQPDRRLTYLGIAEFVARRYFDALDTFRRIAALDGYHHSYMAACHAQLSETANAARHATAVRLQLPDFNAREYVYQIPYREESDRHHHLEALLRAGLGDVRRNA